MKPSRLFSVALLLFVLLTVASTARASSNLRFETDLAGEFEVPTRVTGAEGEAEFKLNNEGTEIRFKLKVEDISNVWMAHIHMAPAGSNGGIVVWLFPRSGPNPPQSIPGEFKGKLAEGVITVADLVGDLSGKPLSALVDAMRAGNTYVNVHTNDFNPATPNGPGDFPPGEIRGQLHEHD